ncbi:hypothetical protein J8L86_09465 [Shewanella sp. MMG014]|uniref:hypothetical protein n=1 Tax=Shewanella sp. MMG014 TaxID=2822691 RepID=UPI001B362764|nr:hypothetical protein [Shewanella sp. MMG014]MBQ4890067.1 hypothetical protein [Shewanella sp. MMG014]
MSNNSHPQWADFQNETDYEKRHFEFDAYCKSYEKWYLTKSQTCRKLAVEGLFWALSALVLHLAVINYFFDLRNSSENYISWFLFLIPIPLIIINLFYDGVGLTLDKIKIRILIKLISVVIMLTPFLVDYVGMGFEGVLLPLVGLGLGVSILCYLLNRLNGYTRAWSRYRTAGYQANLAYARYKSDHLSENDAHIRLLEIIEQEVVSRHKDIVEDFHFFGDKVNGFIPNK